MAREIAALIFGKRRTRLIPTSWNFNNDPAVGALLYPQSVLLCTLLVKIPSVESDKIFAKCLKIKLTEIKSDLNL